MRNEHVIQSAGIAESEFSAVCDSELAKIERRRQRYLGSRERVEVAGRIVIVIDDGVATGATTRAALRAARSRKPKKLILVVPVAPADGLAVLPPRTNLRTSSGLVKGSLTGPDAAGGRRSCMSGNSYRLRSNRILLFQFSAGLGRRGDRAARTISGAKTEPVIPARGLKAGGALNPQFYL